VPTAPRATVTPLRAVAPATRHSRERPFAAEIIANQRITGRASEKDVRHIELDITGAALDYEPGDSLGVWPENASTLVDEVLAAARLDGETSVTYDGDTLPLHRWLAERRELTRLSRPFVAQHAAQARSADLNRLLAPDLAAGLAELLRTHQPVDLLRAFPGDWGADELVAALRPLAPRLYSIASSRKLVGDEAHLTVAHIAYSAFGTPHVGCASHHLATRADGDRVGVYVEPNERFRLPRDSARDLIMIGPGTGVAPFRAFLQERMEIGAGGRHWLIFGNPHFDSDFLYQTEWQTALAAGTLHRLDLAFSRDGANKVYVQHRLHEHARELYDWLERGAHLYVCGDASRMAKDVHAALLDIVAAERAIDRDGAEEYLSVLQQSGRYARDVY